MLSHNAQNDVGAILDGEIICMDGDGVSQFNKLLFRRGVPYFYAFDLMWLNGYDLRAMRLLDRKERFKKLVLRSNEPTAVRRSRRRLRRGFLQNDLRKEPRGDRRET